MNMFILDSDPKLAAEYHCNKHVVKMVLESAQMLCSAHWFSLLNEHGKKLSDFKGSRKAKDWLAQNSSPQKVPPYSFTHTGHPCTVWTAKNMGNYDWHVNFLRCLLDEYTLRYKKQHKCEAVWQWLNSSRPTHLDPSMQVTDFPQAMPAECKVPGDPVQAYRNYYSQHKRRFAKWEPLSKTPYWF